MAALDTHLVEVICEDNLLLLCPQAEQEISLLPFLKDTRGVPRCVARCRAESKEPLIVEVIVVILCLCSIFFVDFGFLGVTDRQNPSDARFFDLKQMRCRSRHLLAYNTSKYFDWMNLYGLAIRVLLGILGNCTYLREGPDEAQLVEDVWIKGGKKK